MLVHGTTVLRGQMWLRTFALLLAAGAAAFLFSACEDSPPTDFTPIPFVEGYLFVDQPIRGIYVTWSQSLADTFDTRKGMVRDANVVIESEGTQYVLEYAEKDGIGSYSLADTLVKVLPDRTYTLSIRLKSGEVLSGETQTPSRIVWTASPKPVLQYPQDTVRLPSSDSLKIAWTSGSVTEYIVRVQCQDTLGYGVYLDPQTAELNGRTNNVSQFETPEQPTFYSTTRWGFIQTTTVPTVWNAFRWYGKNEIAILAPDRNMLEWFKATRFGGRGVYNSRYGSISGGAGAFCSAAVITGNTFLLKRLK